MISLTLFVELEHGSWMSTFSDWIEMTHHNGSKEAVTIYPVNDPWTEKDLLNWKPIPSNMLKNKQTNAPMLCWFTQNFSPLFSGSSPIFCLILIVLSTLASELLKGHNIRKCFSLLWYYRECFFKSWDEGWDICKSMYSLVILEN